jgi:hypothetical protein
MTFRLMVLCFVAVSPQIARAQQPQPQPQQEDPQLLEARQHFEAGRNAYNAADYAGAIREFKYAEQIRPSPILDYNIGLANEKLGKRRVAVKYYRRYLDGAPQANNRAEVQATIASLEQQIAASNVPPPPEQPGDAPPAYQPPPPGYGGQQPSYGDPYQPGSPAPIPPAQPGTRKSYWWVALVVVGAVAVVAVIVAVAVVYGSPTYYAGANTVRELPPRSEILPAPRITPSDRPATPAMQTLFRF